MTCAHEKFLAETRVGRLSKEEGGPIIGFAMDIRVECVDCGLHFRFRHDKFGLNPNYATLSPDSLELRIRIEPAYAPEILGQPITSGKA